MKNNYKTLGIDTFSDLAAVKKAFRQFAKDLHPDKYEYGSEAAKAAGKQMLRYTEAYDAIKTNDKKEKYDRDLRLFLRRHKPAADEVHEPEPKEDDKVKTAWKAAEPQAESQSDPSASEHNSKAEPEPDDARTAMMRRKLQKAYGWEDDDPKPTVDVTM